MDQQTKQSAALSGAQKYFKKAAQDETLAKRTRKKDRANDAMKTEKLRALRLAKEAADKQAAGTDDQRSATPRKRSSATKPAGMVRMRY